MTSWYHAKNFEVKVPHARNFEVKVPHAMPLQVGTYISPGWNDYLAFLMLLFYVFIDFK